MNKALSAVAALGLFCTSLGASTVMDVTFSQDASNYLTITLGQSYSYVVTSNATTNGLDLVFDGAGDYAGSVNSSIASSTITFTLNGTSYTTNFMSSDYDSGDMTKDDLYIMNITEENGNLDDLTLVAGDVITISAGSITTSVATSGCPTSGTYTVYFVDDSGILISVTEAAVPEPSACAAGIGAFALISASILRRRRAA